MLAVKTISRIILRFCLSVLRSSRVPWEEQRSDQREQEAGGDCPQEVFFDRRQIGTKLSCCCHTITLVFSLHKSEKNSAMKYCIYVWGMLGLNFPRTSSPLPILFFISKISCFPSPNVFKISFFQQGPVPPSRRRTQTGSSGWDTVQAGTFWRKIMKNQPRTTKNHKKPTWNHHITMPNLPRL